MFYQLVSGYTHFVIPKSAVEHLLTSTKWLILCVDEAFEMYDFLVLEIFNFYHHAYNFS